MNDQAQPANPSQSQAGNDGASPDVQPVAHADQSDGKSQIPTERPADSKTDHNDQASPQAAQTTAGQARADEPTTPPAAILSIAIDASPKDKTSKAAANFDGVAAKENKNSVDGPTGPLLSHGQPPSGAIGEYSPQVQQPAAATVQTDDALQAATTSEPPQSDKAPAPQISAPEVKLPDAQPHQIENTPDGRNSQPLSVDPPQNSPANANGAAPTADAATAAAGQTDSSPEALVDRIGTNVLQAVQGGQSLRMRLHPPELGVLDIQIVSKDGTLTARLDVHNAAAHQAIQDHMQQLHDMLHRTNAHVDRIELNLLDSQADVGSHSQAGFEQFPSTQQEFDDPLGGQPYHDPSNTETLTDTASPDDPAQLADGRYRTQPLTGIDIHI